MAERRFPIQFGDDIADVPWSLLAPHEAQALTNHGQSLERLAERGGMTPCEALAVIENRGWRMLDPKSPGWPPALPVSSALLRKLVAEWELNRMRTA